MNSFSKSMKPPKVDLYLAKPNRTIIHKLKASYNLKHKIRFGQLNELSFTLPYEIDRKNKLIPNPAIKKIKERYLIKLINGSLEEWYVIIKKKKSSSDSELMDVECVSLGYDLSYKKMINYSVTSYNCLQVTQDCLKDTNWSVGYINPQFNLKYRKFEVNSKTKLEFLNEIASAFEGTIIYETKNKVINIYSEEELIKNKGFSISFGKYIESLEETVDIENVVTRLVPQGSEGLTIHSSNPTGQAYIDDFSYYMYPFEQDEYGEVISSSDFMSDELCIALTEYNLLIRQNEDSFADLLSSQDSMRTTQTEEEYTLTSLKAELTLILDEYAVALESGGSLVEITNRRERKKAEIKSQEESVSAIEKQLEAIEESISNLKSTLKLENNLDAHLITELNDYIFFGEWSDDNIIDAQDLYTLGQRELKKINHPAIHIQVNIVNFFDMIDESHNWDRLSVGDIIKIKHDRLGILIKTKVSEIEIDHEASTINIVISNSKAVQTDDEHFKRFMTSIDNTEKDFNAKKPSWDKNVTNFNLRNDRLTETPINPVFKQDPPPIKHIENDDGSVNLTISWDYPSFNETGDNAHNIDGFILYLHSSLSDQSYLFGSSIPNESPVLLDSERRNFTFPSVPPNRYYTIGVKAYRSVDDDISANGVLESEIVIPEGQGNNPYLPRESVKVVGDLDGRLNDSMRTSSHFEPLVPSEGDVWDDLSENKVKQFDGFEWKVINAANSDSVANFIPSSENLPNTIPIRGEDNVINASIAGDATTLNGKSDSDFVLKNTMGQPEGIVSLDSEGLIMLEYLKRATDKIPKIKVGSYMGDGISGRSFDLGFKPDVVRILSTGADDVSVYINSISGGYKLKNSTNSLILQGNSATPETPTPTFGILIETGFSTGSSVDSYANKLGVTYHWEAYKLPTSQ